MGEGDIRQLLRHVRAGRLSRRGFVRTMLGLGLTVPLAAEMLASAGIARAQTRPGPAPAKRGGGGALKALWWDAPNLLNPVLAVGLKDWNAGSLFYEPLVYFDPQANLVPVLAREVPSITNGGVAKDGTSVTWHLKHDVQWHDGKPFTAQDVVFNWEYAADPATGAPAVGVYRNVKHVEAIDPHTVKFVFTQPTPYWLMTGALIPRHVFESYRGAKSREAPNNLKPIGTGPYRFVDFKPGDLLKAVINPSYHVPGRPFFDTVEVKGGGDAASAARAVLQTGEYDYAAEVGGVEDDVLKRLEQGGKGTVRIAFGGRINHVQLNQSDPWTEVDGERSSVKTVHPFLTDPAVRGALALLVDRSGIQEQILGRNGQVTANFVSAPERFRSKNTRWEFNVDKANQLLARGLDTGRRRRAHPRRQAAQDGAAGCDELGGAKDPGRHQAGRGQGRHRDRAEDGHAVVVLFIGPRQSRHLHALLRRPPAHDLCDGAAGPRAPHACLHVLGDRVEAEQLAEVQRLALAQRGVRPALQGRRDRDGPGQAGRAVHPHE